MAAVVARLDPQAAAKPAPAKLVAMANPPGSRPSHRRIDVKSAVVKPACEVIAPINRNIGIADNVQWAEKSYGMLFRTRSEERRVGKEGVSTVRSRRSPKH